MTLEFIKKRGNYFMTESGKAWIPFGYNESFTWHNLKEDNMLPYFDKLRANKINCLRMIFEYADAKVSLLETKIGEFNPKVVDKWHKIFELCTNNEIRLLMSAYDTYWQWKNWSFHPYNIDNGGYLKDPANMFTDSQTLDIHKNRFNFLIENFSKDGTLFAWDIWNELHPNYSNKTNEGMEDYINSISSFIKTKETELYEKSHLQTCSIFGPALDEHKALNLHDHIFRNANLDFANPHIYEFGTIDDPKNTIDPAIAVGKYIKQGIAEIKDVRPIFDSETGPIHRYNDLNSPLEEDFDNEYFFNMSWAHLASGGAGSGMRWPYRNPHILTDNMLDTLSSMATFSEIINWNRFSRDNLSNSVTSNLPKFIKIFACGSASKFLIFALRTNALTNTGMYDTKATPLVAQISIPDVTKGLYKLTSWKADDKQSSVFLQNAEASRTGGTSLNFSVQLKKCLIIYAEKT